jgi:hypothetical protein
MLQKKLCLQTGTCVSEQLLTINGEPLKCDELLSELFPEQEARVHLDRKMSGDMSLFVRIFKRTEIEIKVDPTTTIEEIKQQIFEKTRIPAGQQKLALGNIELEDQLTANEYGLLDGSQIELKECSCLDCPYRTRFY